MYQEGYREERLFEGESLEDILDSAAQKCGRGGFMEEIDRGRLWEIINNDD